MSDKDLKLRQRRDLRIAQGCLTNSKRPQSFVEGIYPTSFVRSEGCFSWDVDGNRYVDFMCSLGTNLLGHGNPKIVSAIGQQLKGGISHSLGTRLEVEFAEKVNELFPYIEKIKILKSGSEGCAAAIRIARAYTGRDGIYSEGYHGWTDEFTSMTPPASGIIKNQFRSIFPLSDGASKSVAGVIVEPIVTDIGEARLENLRRIRKWCSDTGALLIFDETITAFRFPGLSVSNWCGVVPDLTIMGKALGAGLPISIVGGKSKVMDCDYFVSGTFGGECLSISSAMAVMDILSKERKIEQLWGDGERFLSSFNEISPDLIRIVGYPTRGTFVAKDDETKAMFMQEMCKGGVFFHPSTWFWCLGHNEESHSVLKMAQAVLNRIKNGEVKLLGNIPQKPIAERSRQ